MTMSKEMTAILSCNGCNDVYTDKVYQCVNGHGFCKTCLDSLISESSDSDSFTSSSDSDSRTTFSPRVSCSMCRGTLVPSNGATPIIRNRDLEKMMDLITVPCRYKFLR